MKSLLKTAAAGLVAALALAPAKSIADERKSAPRTSELPPAKLSLWLDGFHMRDAHPEEQSDIHHFCATPKTGPIQCALWDGYGENAKLMGIEYIIDEKTFASLPEPEKALWHSHVYEVTSGMLVTPGMSEGKETEFLKKAISTYGKTWHTWDMEASAEVPLGRPVLMMAFTRNGVLRPALAEKRDADLRTNTSQLKESRAQAIPEVPKIQKGADRGERGTSCKDNTEIRRARRAPPAR
ncbi:MAG: DUF1264 domain-containing protein [Myxococcales bacterium]|nr:DUF1264 domain-containing protein [Myxococcales bacterium]